MSHHNARSLCLTVTKYTAAISFAPNETNRVLQESVCLIITTLSTGMLFMLQIWQVVLGKRGRLR